MIRKVLGVKIDDVSKKEALEIVSTWFLRHSGKRSASRISYVESDSGPGPLRREASQNDDRGSKLIFTPGPEFLLSAQKDEDFRQILNAADLSLPDGFGLQLYAGIRNRVPGREFMLDLCQTAAENGWSIGLVGGWKGDGQKIKDNLEKRFPKIKISVVIDGDEATKIKNGSDIDNYIKQDIDILFVGFGHPWQEKILYALDRAQRAERSRDPSASLGIRFKIGMGVGGALDYLAGRVPKPPRFVQVIGLEWFWRLVTQPRRLGRILKATFVFPAVLFWNRGKICS